LDEEGEEAEEDGSTVVEAEARTCWVSVETD